MKKEDAVQAMDNLGHTLNDLRTSVWMTALNPQESGPLPTVLSIAAIPLVSIATIGHFVAAVIVTETPESVYDTVSNLGGGKKEP